MTTILEWIQQHPIAVLRLIGLLTFGALHVLWYIRPSDITTATDIQTYLVNGKPTIIEFYSNL